MKILGKLCLFLSVFCLGLMGAYSYADATGMNIILRPGLNVVSTPALLSSISFSNGGNGISFSKLENGQWVSIVPSTGVIRPLEGFLVRNSNNLNVNMTLSFQDEVGVDAMLQKELDLGWNFLGITTVTNPFNNIAGTTTMSVDFTNNGETNLFNSVNSSYLGNQNSSMVSSPQYGEAYGVFVTSNNAIYGGINNRTSNYNCTPAQVNHCTLTQNFELCLSNCATLISVSGISLQDYSTMAGQQDVIAISFKIYNRSYDNIEIRKVIFSGDSFVDSNTIRNAILRVNGTDYGVNVQSGTIKVMTDIELYAGIGSPTTFTLLIDLDSNPTITTGFRYYLSEIELKDEDTDEVFTYTGFSVTGRKISIVDNGELSVMMDNTNYNNRYPKSILAGTRDAVIAEYKLRAINEDIRVRRIELEFDQDISQVVDRVKIIVGGVVFDSTSITPSKVVFDGIHLDVSQHELPISVALSTTDGVMYNAKINQILFTGLYGESTGNPINSVTGGESNTFDIVPATIVASVTSTTNAQTKVNLSVNKSNNAHVYLRGLTLSTSTNSHGLEYITITNPLNAIIMTGINGDFDFSNVELLEGDNEITFYYTIGDANNPSYTVDLTDVRYSTSLDPTAIFSSRMQGILNLVSR